MVSISSGVSLRGRGSATNRPHPGTTTTASSQRAAAVSRTVHVSVCTLAAKEPSLWPTHVHSTWYSMLGSYKLLRQMAQVSVQIAHAHIATAFHFLISKRLPGACSQWDASCAYSPLTLCAAGSGCLNALDFPCFKVSMTQSLSLSKVLSEMAGGLNHQAHSTPPS